MYIVGHVSPDWDCIGALWLLKRFYAPLADAEIALVNTGNPDRALLDSADAVVDTGRMFYSPRLRFDHHQMPGSVSNSTCAALLVYGSLIIDTVSNAEEGQRLSALEPLIDLIYQGDTGKPEANQSRLTGIHALLSAQKAKRLTDQELIAYGFSILDDIAASLLARQEARRTLEAHTVYTSEDRLLVALHNAPQGATWAAFEQGAQLVVFYTESPDVPTYARGIMRASEYTQPHCGELIGLVLDSCGSGVYPPNDECRTCNEVKHWYRHEAGFFAGNGTAKAPNPNPMMADIIDIAAAIDSVWQR
jgi:hypothetical protein